MEQQPRNRNLLRTTSNSGAGGSSDFLCQGGTLVSLLQVFFEKFEFLCIYNNSNDNDNHNHSNNGMAMTQRQQQQQQPQ
jgi:hypothetical protein